MGEDSFNFSWGWQKLFAGYKVGINYLSFKFGEDGKISYESKDGRPCRVSTYRFRDRDAIHFDRSLDLDINWSKEFRSVTLDKLRKRNQQGAGWVDYAVTTYWYASDPKGLGLAMPPIDERMKLVLHQNSP